MAKKTPSFTDRVRRYLWALFICLVVATCVYAAWGGTRLYEMFAPGDRFPAMVERVVDGDTIVARMPDDESLRIRLIGVDTPELAHNSGETSERYSRKATDFTQAALLNREVLLEYDEERLDRYGRTLAYVWLDEDELFNETLVRAGMAKAYPYLPNTKYVARLARAETAAKRDRLGMWANSSQMGDPRKAAV